jgi:hypothetical protein
MILINEEEGLLNPGVGLVLIGKGTVLDLLAYEVLAHGITDIGRHAHLKRRNHRAVPVRRGHRRHQLKRKPALRWHAVMTTNSRCDSRKCALRDRFGRSGLSGVG